MLLMYFYKRGKKEDQESTHYKIQSIFLANVIFLLAYINIMNSMYAVIFFRLQSKSYYWLYPMTLCLFLPMTYHEYAVQTILS